ncbi:MAG: DUF4395 domain-containing protein [Bacteroidales bacterium]|nr:DUF4395 domain-containing protein [Bacteroidales bacterium]
MFKNVVCPVSNEKVPEHLPRVTAFLNIALIVIYLHYPTPFLLAFLTIDFFVRGYNQPKYSLLNYMARNLSRLLRLKSKPIDRAPKIFAARLGGVMFLSALIINLLGGIEITYVITIMVATLSTLECVFNFCVGCYMYNYLVLPFYSKN